MKSKNYNLNSNLPHGFRKRRNFRNNGTVNGKAEPDDNFLTEQAGTKRKKKGLKKNEVRNIAHITVNTGNVVVYPDDSVIFDRTKPAMQDMVEQAVASGIVSVMDDPCGSIKVRCSLDLERGAYMAVLYYEERPETLLLETAGTLNAEAGKEIWEQMKMLHKESWESGAPDMECPKEPFICDLLNPSIIFAPQVTSWSGGFTKCFGISILNMMSRYKAIMEMEGPSEAVRDGMILVNRKKQVRGSLMEFRDYAIFEIDQKGASMKIFFNSPTPAEMKEFAAGGGIHAGLADVEGIIMFAVKVGNLNWVATPCGCLTKSSLPGKGQELTLKLALINAGTGEVIWTVATKLPEKFREIFAAAAVGRKDKREYGNAVERIYSQYSVQQIVERFASGEPEEA